MTDESPSSEQQREKVYAAQCVQTGDGTSEIGREITRELLDTRRHLQTAIRHLDFGDDEEAVGELQTAYEHLEDALDGVGMPTTLLAIHGVHPDDFPDRDGEDLHTHLVSNRCLPVESIEVIEDGAPEYAHTSVHPDAREG